MEIFSMSICLHTFTAHIVNVHQHTACHGMSFLIGTQQQFSSCCMQSVLCIRPDVYPLAVRHELSPCIGAVKAGWGGAWVGSKGGPTAGAGWTVSHTYSALAALHHHHDSCASGG